MFTVAHQPNRYCIQPFLSRAAALEEEPGPDAERVSDLPRTPPASRTK
jgi:hypothetical protein